MPLIFTILDELARQASLEKMLHSDSKVDEFGQTLEGKMAKVS